MRNYIVLEMFPNYEIHRKGVIIRKEHTSQKGSKLKRKEIVQTKSRNDYRTVSITDKNGHIKKLYVHRLVYMAFNGEIPKGMEIDHISGERGNNSLNNLRLVTHEQNCRNPITIAKYKKSNSVDRGKYNYERMKNAIGKEAYEKAKQRYIALHNKYGSVSVWVMVSEGHVGYPRARKICKEMSDQNDMKWLNNNHSMES